MQARFVWLVVGSLLCGCRANLELGSNSSSPARSAKNVTTVETQGAAVVSDAVHKPQGAVRLPSRRLLFEGLLPPAGRMGDAEDPQGPLVRRMCFDDFRSKPNCEEWIYDPTDANSPQRWAGVAYQYTQGKYNFGQTPGKNLKGQGFTHVTFWARANCNTPVQLVVKSGGHTSYDARYPASYLVEHGMVELGRQWQFISIPIEGLDHSNVVCGLAFTLLADNGPASFLIDDLAFEGP